MSNPQPYQTRSQSKKKPKSSNEKENSDSDNSEPSFSDAVQTTTDLQIATVPIELQKLKIIDNSEFNLLSSDFPLLVSKDLQTIDPKFEAKKSGSSSIESGDSQTKNQDLKSQTSVKFVNNSKVHQTEKPNITERVQNPIENTMDKLNIELAFKLIPEFSGDSSSLHKFIACCDLVHEPLSEEEKAKFLNILKSRLSGDAYNVVKYQKFDTWEALKKELIHKFGEIRSIPRIQAELIDCKQSSSESVKLFALKIEKLLSELNEACIESQGAQSAEFIRKLNDQTALQAFQEGLTSSIGLVIKACQFKELKEAINKALTEEAFKNRKTHDDDKPKTVNPSKCQICNKRGHSSPECYQRYNTTFNNSRSKPSRPESRSINIICAYCKKPGHNINVCRKREKRNQQSQSSFSPDSNNRNSFSSENLKASNSNENTTVRANQLK